MRSRVELNGNDISSALTGVRLCLDAGAMPTATLDICAWEIPVDLDQVRIEIPARTQALLVELGWTPPQDTSEPRGGEA